MQTCGSKNAFIFCSHLFQGSLVPIPMLFQENNSNCKPNKIQRNPKSKEITNTKKNIFKFFQFFQKLKSEEKWRKVKKSEEKWRKVKKHHFSSLFFTFLHFSSLFFTFLHFSSLFFTFHHFSIFGKNWKIFENIFFMKKKCGCLF